jgi:hypothetical protein
MDTSRADRRDKRRKIVLRLEGSERFRAYINLAIAVVAGIAAIVCAYLIG